MSEEIILWGYSNVEQATEGEGADWDWKGWIEWIEWIEWKG